MTHQRMLKLLHLIGTFWFALCTMYLIIYKVLEAKVHWWVVISLSGPSIAVAVLLFLVYLFAIFRGATRIEKTESENPLTVMNSYMVFYYFSPCLGGVAGILAMIGSGGEFRDYVLVSALGTFFLTFVVWIIIDPAISLIEMLLPTSRAYHHKRLENIRLERDTARRNLDQLIVEYENRQEKQKQHWEEALSDETQILVNLLADKQSHDLKRRHHAVDIGVKAWQTGGLACMRWLHDLAMRLSQPGDGSVINYDPISFWWDGIGGWRDQGCQEKGRLFNV